MNTKDTQGSEADLVPIGEAAKILGVSVGTVRRWEQEGKLSAIRTLGGQRRFSRDDLDKAKGAAA